MGARAMTSRSALLALVCTLLAAACAEQKTVTDPELSDPPPAFPGLVGPLTCTANIDSRSISCRPADGSRADWGPQMLIVGGQGTNVLLTSSGTDYNPSSQVFFTFVTVQNLWTEPLGTPDGTTPTFVRVFHNTGPSVTVGTGSVSSKGHTATYTCTATGQPYYEYQEILAISQTSASMVWSWQISGSVEEFVFTVLVEADTPTDQSHCKPGI